MKKLLKELREYRSDVLPVVLKNPKMKQLSVVYHDHSEFYRLDGTYRGQEGSPYNWASEIEMAKGNGFHEIHAKQSWATE